MASEYLKWKYRDVKPDEPIVLTPQEKRRNWWRYNWWHVLLGVIVLIAAGNLLMHVLGIGQVQPDYQIAYVGSTPLPQDSVKALETAMAELGQDCNDDGRVVVKLHSYTDGNTVQDGNGAANSYAASVTLMADLTDCDSYFFLLEDPAQFQRNYQVLRRLDGTLPKDTDTDYESCYVAWTDCPALAALPLGEYSETILGREVEGSNQAVFSGLYLARRGFWTEETTDYPEESDALWDALTKGAVSP